MQGTSQAELFHFFYPFLGRRDGFGFQTDATYFCWSPPSERTKLGFGAYRDVFMKELAVSSL
jgi:hypothetical protein